MTNRVGTGAGVGSLAMMALELLPLSHDLLVGAAVVVGVLLELAVAAFMRPLGVLDRRVQSEVVDNPMMQAVYSGKRSEVGRTELALRLLQAGQRQVLGRILEHAHSQRQGVEASAGKLVRIGEQIDRQHAKIDLVATAMHEMTAMVQEVARNTAKGRMQGAARKTRRPTAAAWPATSSARCGNWSGKSPVRPMRSNA